MPRVRDFRPAALDAYASHHALWIVWSDLDFLVDFQPMPPSAHSKAYFGLWFALQDLFGRKVDLVEMETVAVTNPFFLKAILPSRRVLYAA